MRDGPKILFADIETSPLEVYCWQLGDQNINLGQLKKDWHLMSVAARWAHDPAGKVLYKDQSGRKDVSNDLELCEWAWNLLDRADVIIGQNSKAFDIKKLYARFKIHKLKPPSPFQQMDTLKMARKHFAFTSNKLAYLSETLCERYQKSEHAKFPGLELWKECLGGNPEAWREMAHYNKIDVLATEETFQELQPWDNGLNLDVYSEGDRPVCNCGSSKLQQRGYAFTKLGRYARYQCMSCGRWHRGGQNLHDASKRATILR